MPVCPYTTHSGFVYSATKKSSKTIILQIITIEGSLRVMLVNMSETCLNMSDIFTYTLMNLNRAVQTW